MKKIKEIKGFTLVELLAVIALVAVFSGLAVTNIVSSINNSRKNQFLLDAKRMISKAEALIAENRDYRTIAQTASGITFRYKNYTLNAGKLVTVKGLNEKGEFDKDADAGTYNDNTYVKVTYASSKYVYCVYASGSKRHIGTESSCITKDNLKDINQVIDN